MHIRTLFTFVDSTKTAFMCNVKQFLHKVTPAVMKSSGAVIPGTEEVCGNWYICDMIVYRYHLLHVLIVGICG